MIGAMGSRLVVAAVGGLLLLASASPAQAGISPSEALTILNQWRAEAHVPAVGSMDPAKNTGCDHHDNYMHLNGDQLTHSEESGKPGYTSDGAAAGASSVLAFTESTPRIWESAVYHRMGILQPRLTTSGWAASHNFTCMQTIDLPTGTAGTPVTTHPWPPDGATNVPTAFKDQESPNPYDLTPGVPQLGYLLSVNIAGPWYGNYSSNVKVTDASLATDAGTPVVLTVVDDSTPGGGPGGAAIGPYINDAFALFPHGALRPATAYTAHAAGSLTASGTPYPFDVTWHFTTAGQPVPGAAKLKLSKGKAAGKKVSFVLTAAQPRVGRSAVVTVDGKKPQQFTLAASQELKVSRPGKGKTITVKVTTPAFVSEGVSYPAGTASRKFTRPK
jgi:hypothetical protein